MTSTWGGWGRGIVGLSGVILGGAAACSGPAYTGAIVRDPVADRDATSADARAADAGSTAVSPPPPTTGTPPGPTADAVSPPPCVSSPAPAGIWTEVAPRAGDNGLAVTDSFGVAADDILFAGTTAPGSTGNQLRVVRWTKGCWTLELSLPIDPSASTASVHGTGPNDLWAAGGDLLLHDDGTGWQPFDDSWRGKISLTPRDFATPPGPTLMRVRDVASNDVWVNEIGNVMHWSNGAWTTFNFDDPDYPNVPAAVAYSFRDIWIDSPTSVWVSGAVDQVGNTMSPGIIKNFDGTTWGPAIGEGLSVATAMWRSGATLWVANGLEPDGTSIFPFPSDSQSPFPPPITGFSITGKQLSFITLWGRGAGDIWAGGNDVAHFDGATWSLDPTAPDAARAGDGTTTFTFVGGEPDSTWLVTPGPRFFRKPATAP
ncbi:MAG TPA: hypothetical protein VHH90_04640 [Polyangia bacterium]|nr:hypothetical protein [Polyangia bacterium]